MSGSIGQVVKRLPHGYAKTTMRRLAIMKLLANGPMTAVAIAVSLDTKPQHAVMTWHADRHGEGL